MITKIDFKNHPILGNLSLNFCKQDGKPFKNVVLIGENGCGKTTILEQISNFFEGGNTTHVTLECKKADGTPMNKSNFETGSCYTGIQTRYSYEKEYVDIRERDKEDIDTKTYEKKC